MPGARGGLGGEGGARLATQPGPLAARNSGARAASCWALSERCAGTASSFAFRVSLPNYLMVITIVILSFQTTGSLKASSAAFPPEIRLHCDLRGQVACYTVPRGPRLAWAWRAMDRAHSAGAQSPQQAATCAAAAAARSGSAVCAVHRWRRPAGPHGVRPAAVRPPAACKDRRAPTLW